MFVRFRQSPHRLQVSLVETRRVDRKVRHEHVASLGAVAVPPSVADRVAYWEQLHSRLGRLSNRLDMQIQSKILNAVHARIATPTIEERRALQLEYAEEEERFWSEVQGMHQSTVADQKGLIATVESDIAEGQAGATRAGERAAAAKDRMAWLKAGEDVIELGTRPMTRKEMIAAIGWTPRQVRRAERIHQLHEIGAEEELLDEMDVRKRRADEAALRAVYKRHFRSPQRGNA
jgi:hypothetical protein